MVGYYRARNEHRSLKWAIQKEKEWDLIKPKEEEYDDEDDEGEEAAGGEEAPAGDEGGDEEEEWNANDTRHDETEASVNIWPITSYHSWFWESHRAWDGSLHTSLYMTVLHLSCFRLQRTKPTLLLQNKRKFETQTQLGQNKHTSSSI